MQPSGWTRASRALHNSLFSQRAAGKRLRFNLGRYSPRIWTRAPARWCILFLFWCATLLGVLISLDIKFYSLMHFCVARSRLGTRAEGGTDRKGPVFYAHWTRPLFTSACRLLPVISYAEQRMRPPLQDTHTLWNQYAAPLLPLQPHRSRAQIYPFGINKKRRPLGLTSLWPISPLNSHFPAKTENGLAASMLVSQMEK
jgi:hypothetical protein